MPTQTDFLKLKKPKKGEYTETWHVPVNENSDAIDAFAAAVDGELAEARGPFESLADFLAVSHGEDGAVRAPDEVVSSRNSPVYGDKKDDGSEILLPDRLALADREVFDAREGAATLAAALAVRSYQPDMVLSGLKNANGYPTWLGYTGASLTVNGADEELWLSIDGYRRRIRKTETIALSGASGTYYLYADLAATGVLVRDGDSENGEASAANGTTSNGADSIPRIFTDATVTDWTLLNVRAGDVLTILDSNDAGAYIIASVGVDGDNSQLEIKGRFPAGGISSLNYTIHDMLGVTLGTDVEEEEASARLFIAEADFDGSAVTAVRPRHYRDTFVGEWVSIDVSDESLLSQTWNHRLGTTELDVAVQVSQANDGSAPVEQLSIAHFANTLAVSNTLAVDKGTLGVTTTGSVDLSAVRTGTENETLTGSPVLSAASTVGGAPALTGSISLSGSATLLNAVRARWTKNKIDLKGLSNGQFYTDFDNVVRQTGYIRVLLRKRG